MINWFKNKVREETGSVISDLLKRGELVKPNKANATETMMVLVEGKEVIVPNFDVEYKVNNGIGFLTLFASLDDLHLQNKKYKSCVIDLTDDPTAHCGQHTSLGYSRLRWEVYNFECVSLHPVVLAFQPTPENFRFTPLIPER